MHLRPLPTYTPVHDTFPNRSPISANFRLAEGKQMRKRGFILAPCSYVLPISHFDLWRGSRRASDYRLTRTSLELLKRKLVVGRAEISSKLGGGGCC